MLDDSESVEERYRNAKELLQVENIGMYDAKLAYSHIRARKQFENAPPPPTSTSEDKDEDCEKYGDGVDEGCRDSHFKSPQSPAPAIDKDEEVFLSIGYHDTPNVQVDDHCTPNVQVDDHRTPTVRVDDHNIPLVQALKPKRYKRMEKRLVKHSQVHKSPFVKDIC